MHIQRHWIIVFCSTFIFLSGIFLTKAQNSINKVADSLYSSGTYGIAAIEYEKAYFKSDNLIQRTQARLMRVECLKQTGRYQDALSDLNELAVPGLPDSLNLKIRYQSALCSYLSENFTDARSQLELYHFASGDQKAPDHVFLLEILTANQLYDYQKSRDLALKWISGLNIPLNRKDSLTKVIDLMYNKSQLPRISKERTAGLLSSFIPGSGQMYAGFSGEGLINFMLSATVLGTGVYAFIEGYYLTGYLFGAGMLQKLYFGGIRRAKFLNEKGNYRRTKSYNDQLREVMLELYSVSR